MAAGDRESALSQATRNMAQGAAADAAAKAAAKKLGTPLAGVDDALANPTSAKAWGRAGARSAVAYFITPAGEAIVNFIGYRRTVLIVVTAVIVAIVLIISMFYVAISAVVSAPMQIASSIIEPVTSFFTGDDQAAQKEFSQLSTGANGQCVGVPSVSASASATSWSGARPSTIPTPSRPPSASGEDLVIRLDHGRVPAAAGPLLVPPVPKGTPALVAQVWFMWRMAGMGPNWETFIGRYRVAALHENQKGRGAALDQIQKLNREGVDIEKYRQPAAALTLAGIKVKRYESPGEDFVEELGVELLSGCLPNDPVASSRQSAPPPVVAAAPRTTTPPR